MKSPCIKKCKLFNGVCVGCKRTIKQIKEYGMKNEIEKMKVDIQNVKELSAKLNLKIIEMVNKLRNICPHENVIDKEDCIPGSYYDRTQYITESYCDDCGKYLGIVKTTTGGYG